MKIAIGSDHAGFQLKQLILSEVKELGHEISDLGAFTDEHPADDYHSIGAAVAQAVARGAYERGIVICGTGIGISIAANKVPGAYAALCNDLFTAQKSREHNDANVLALGARVVGVGLAKEIVRIWLATSYALDRHEARNANLRRIEASYLSKTERRIAMEIIIGSDHIGRGLKDGLSGHLKELGYKVVDIGVNQDTPVDYPDIAQALAERVGQGEFQRGLLVCGTGIGMAIAANKVPNVRAACCHDPYSAERARKSNDAQIITFGSQVIGAESAKTLLEIWLESEFSGGRSTPKVEKLKALDQHYRKQPDGS